jgi:hypothetical protein
MEKFFKGLSHGSYGIPCGMLACATAFTARRVFQLNFFLALLMHLLPDRSKDRGR